MKPRSAATSRLPSDATRPARAKVLSIRLNPTTSTHEWTASRETSYNVIRAERIEWDGKAAAHHIRTRSLRYPAAVDIEPDWTVEVVNDPERIVDEPGPLSIHANSVRVVSYSPSAAMVITVVALRNPQEVLHGATAWRTTGRPRPSVPGRTIR